MPDITAQILIEDPEGIRGHYTQFSRILLLEGSTPVWISQRERHPDYSMRRIVWTATVENMLDDALVMAAVHVLENEQILASLMGFLKKGYQGLSLYDDLTQQQREALYAQCKEIFRDQKIIVMVFEDSSVQQCLSTLQDYQMDCQVLMPAYRQRRYFFNQELVVRGSFDVFPYGERPRWPEVSPFVKNKKPSE